MINAYPMQTLVRLAVNFTTVALPVTPVDPTTVTLALSPPPPDDTAQVITSGIVRTGPGAYYYDTVITAEGLWRARWQGTGAVIANSGDDFFRGV